jgi:dipeptidyl aminopeptidase/acylaminoacyl peptidase
MNKLSVVGAVLISAALLPAAERLSLTDIFQIQTAAQPRISPDGKRIVYQRNFADITTDRRYSNLWIVNFDGTGDRPLTSGNFSDADAHWSPSGAELVFTSNRGGTDHESPAQIWRMWIDSGQMAQVTRLNTSPANLNWSPDGEWISFVAHVPQAGPKIADLPAAPEGAKWADPPKVIDQLVYRFNGAGYLKPGYTQVFVIPKEGGAARQISHGNYQHGGVAFQASEPVWSPDGKYLIMSANRHDNYELEPRNSEVYEFRVNDGEVKALTRRDGPDSQPAISPDGNWIAYTAFDEKLQSYQVNKLYVMRRDGSESRTVTVTWDRDVQQPRWAPDGQNIYFLSDDQGDTGLYSASLDGVVKKLAMNIGSSLSAYGGGGSFSVAANGNFATTYARPDVPGDIAVASLSNPSLKVITTVNEGLLSGRELGKVEEIHYESSKDKRQIQAWIVKPPNFDPARKYPLILEIHGGPFADYGDRFDIEKQLMAAKDYVVLYTNPRGSTSYGAEFGNLIHHAYPGDDFYDLNSGVDAVIAKGYIDPDHLYITGGSGGGVLTCWTIGHTTRFRAAAPVYPVINWYSFVLTSDIGNWVSKVWFPGLPWDNVEHYEKRSLLSVVKNVKTPTMVMTGEADYRTPISDSEQYYQALKLLGMESVLVRVPEEPHGISLRPSHQMTKVAYIVGWFERHK